jgi:hypothetical protein
MVATSSPRLPDTTKMLLASGISVDERDAIQVASEIQWGGNSLVFGYEDAQVAVSLMPMPIPAKELEGPCATAWWWPDAVRQLETHRYHFLLTLIGGTVEPVERRIVLTRLTSAVVRHTDAVGVYWGEGTLVHEPAAFVREAQRIDAGHIPGHLWIDVRVERNQGGTHRGFTTGMEPLGFPDIEVQKSERDPEELMAFIADTAAYIVNNRLHIQDGETLGRSADEQYEVRHGRSMFDRSRVMRILMA